MALLSVQNLETAFHTREGVVKAVDDVSFDVDQGKITAIIGESGSGKSVACYSVLGLVPSPPGRIEGGKALFEDRDLLQMSEDDLRAIRGKDIAMIFQDPMTCLNPYMRIGQQLVEPLRYHRRVSKTEAKAKAIALLNEVGIKDPERRYNAFPHELSGGMRQRVMIAMALINEPKLIIADEPTTALDVTIQAQILRLVAELQEKRNIGVLFISHDLSVVADIADTIIVMRKGKVVERGSRDDIFNNPQHDYTKKLLNAVPAEFKPPVELNQAPLVVAESIRVEFGDKENPVVAVNDVSLEVKQNEILGLVGESGSGKTTLGRSILNLAPIAGGKVTFRGEPIHNLSSVQMRTQRKHMQMIFQDPYSSLNPRMTVYDALAEPMLLHKICTRAELEANVMQLMDQVGLARKFVRKYPHEFSGGQRQRIAIGRALATKPAFVVADEPVSALDVTIQAQILDLLLNLVKEFDLTMLFISHDLAVVKYIADRILVMYHGNLVEQGTSREIFANPQEDYTKRLLGAIPGKSLLDHVS